MGNLHKTKIAAKARQEGSVCSSPALNKRKIGKMVARKKINRETGNRRTSIESERVQEKEQHIQKYKGREEERRTKDDIEPDNGREDEHNEEEDRISIYRDRRERVETHKI